MRVRRILILILFSAPRWKAVKMMKTKRETIHCGSAPYTSDLSASINLPSFAHFLIFLLFCLLSTSEYSLQTCTHPICTRNGPWGSSRELRAPSSRDCLECLPLLGYL